jgi:hypothetical protein
VFEQALFKCQELVASQSGRKKFRFKNKLMSPDGSIIDLSVSMFDWAKHRRTKGAIKLHLLLDHDGNLPSFAVVTEGKASEIKVARTLRFGPGKILAIDRGYNDYEWFRELTQEEVYFVTRMRDKAVYEVKEELQVPQNSNVVGDQIICFPRLGRAGEDPVLFRRVEIWDQGAEANDEDQDVCGDQRQCGPHAGVDGADRDAGAEAPAIEIGVFLVFVDTGGAAVPAIVLLSRSVGVCWTILFRPHLHWRACMITRNNLRSRGRHGWTHLRYPYLRPQRRCRAAQMPTRTCPDRAVASQFLVTATCPYPTTLDAESLSRI